MAIEDVGSFGSATSSHGATEGSVPLGAGGNGESARHERRAQGEHGSGRQLSVARLLRDLIGDLGDLTRQEIALAKAEMNEKVEQVQAGAGMIGAGSALALAGLVVLLMAFVYALDTAMPLWGAALLVGGIAVLAGVLVLVSGKNKIAASRLAPTRTAASIRRDAAAISNPADVRADAPGRPDVTRAGGAPIAGREADVRGEGGPTTRSVQP